MAIKKAILKRYDVTEESYRRKLQARKRKLDESYVNLATDIMESGYLSARPFQMHWRKLTLNSCCLSNLKKCVCGYGNTNRPPAQRRGTGQVSMLKQEPLLL